MYSDGSGLWSVCGGVLVPDLHDRNHQHRRQSHLGLHLRHQVCQSPRGQHLGHPHQWEIYTDTNCIKAKIFQVPSSRSWCPRACPTRCCWCWLGCWVCHRTNKRLITRYLVFDCQYFSDWLASLVPAKVSKVSLTYHFMLIGKFSQRFLLYRLPTREKRILRPNLVMQPAESVLM